MTNEDNIKTNCPEQSQEGHMASNSKRRLLQATAVAPVLLMTGRSALACNGTTDNNCAMSLAAWLSVHPKKGVTVTLSHTHGTTACGKPPQHWKPNCKDYGGYTAFNSGCVWPDNAPPFGPYKCGYTTIYYKSANCSGYKNLYHIDPTTKLVCGWDRGKKLAGMSKSISQHMIDNANSLESWVGAAYLNACKYGSQYPLTTSQIEYLYQNRCLPGQRQMYDSEIVEYIRSTCVA